MKLVDKIQQAHSGKLSDYSKIYTPTAEVIEQIADDYAIKFAEWCMNNYNTLKPYDVKILLDSFKKEKGL